MRERRAEKTRRSMNPKRERRAGAEQPKSYYLGEDPVGSPCLASRVPVSSQRGPLPNSILMLIGAGTEMEEAQEATSACSIMEIPNQANQATLGCSIMEIPSQAQPRKCY